MAIQIIDSPRFSHDIDSTPFVSEPSSPSGYFFSAPTSPTHFKSDDNNNNNNNTYGPVFLSSEFEFSSRFSHIVSMSSADELFFNGQIRPIKVLESSNVRHRKARSMSPFSSQVSESIETTPSCSASSSRSSSSGRNSSNKWIFLKDLLHRSPKMGEKRGKKVSANGVEKRKVPISAHELHYTAKRAQAEEMKKKTYLPYRQGLLGCLGFSSKSYAAFTKNLNPISSR